MNQTRKFRWPAILLAAAIGLLTACSGGSDSSDLTLLTSTAADSKPALSSGAQSSSDSAPLSSETPSTGPTTPGTSPTTNPSTAPETSATEPTVTIPEEPTEPLESGPITMSKKNLTTLSASGNVIVFIVDRFDEKYAAKAYAETPDVYSELTGFTWFQDHISMFGHTYPATAWLLTNTEYDCAQSRKNYLNSAYDGNTPLQKLRDAGYTINVYTETKYSYYSVDNLPEYFANVIPCADPDSRGYSIDLKSVYNEVAETDFTLKSGKTFSFIHIEGCHGVKYNEKFETPTGSDKGNTATSVRVSFMIINRYIQEMKRLGVYDDATIIITGDHGSAISDSREVRESRLTALFAKPSGSDNSPLKISSAQVSHEDFWATIFKSEGLDYSDYGTSVFDVEEGTDRVRYHRWHTYVTGSLDEYVYEITGPGSKFANWKEVAHTHYDNKSLLS